MPDRIIRGDATIASESLGQLSDFAERLFWRLTTIADDFGRFPANPIFINGRAMALVASATPKKIADALLELQSMDSIRLYEVGGKKYGFFPAWLKHQRQRAKESRYPDPVLASDNMIQHMSADVAVVEGSPLARASNSTTTTDPDLNLSSLRGESERGPALNGNGKHVEPVTPEELVQGWNDLCASKGLLQASELNGSRLELVIARISEHPDYGWWSKVLNNIAHSPFCLGKTPPLPGKKKWRASFDWLIKDDEKAVRAYEGNYGD
jgi:hypothetical protein